MTQFLPTPLSTDAPPATAGPYTLTAFANDARPNHDLVTTVPCPVVGGNITFSIPMVHTKVGDGWATWSHGYTGDLYFVEFPDDLESFTISLPPNVGAFMWYMEPNVFSTFTVVYSASDGTTSGTQPVEAENGASGFGWYAPVGQTITSITMRDFDTETIEFGFAFGEFLVAEGAGDTGITFSKTTNVDDPTAEFIITVGPGLDPATFTLKGGDSVTYAGLDPEVTYFCSEGQVCGWSQAAIVVSDGTADAIELTEGEMTTVEFQNETAPVIPGENGCAPITSNRRLIRRLRQSPHIANQGQWTFIHNFELWMDVGVGLNTSQGQGSDPMIHLQISKDGGATWGASMPMSVGKLGEYRQRVIWWRLGQARDWVFRVTCSDPVAWGLVQAYMDLDPGIS
jgi:hypothetical protein